MGNDITSSHAAAIAASKVFETSDNLRCGKYRLLLKRLIDGMITTRDGERPGVILEMVPLEAEPLPQTEGNMLLNGAIVPFGTAGATLMDDGKNPCAVGSAVALKIFFDGTGARSAPGNVRQVVLGLFNKHEGEIPNNDVAKTWCEFMTTRPYKKGEVFATLPDQTQLVADRDLPQNAVLVGNTTVSSALVGFVIDCVVVSRKKSKTNDKGSHISKPTFSNRSVPGTGDNTAELIAKRRAEIEAAMEDEEEIVAPVAPGQTGTATNGQTTNGAAAVPPAVPPIPGVAAPAPPAPWTPPAPWHKPAGHPQYVTNADPKQNWFWNGTNAPDSVRSEAQLRGQ